MRNIAVFIEGQRLDLFDDETIELNRSVQDIQDISKIYTDFTQSFNVPASKNNNRILKHFERPEIDNGYDTRIKKNGAININSLDFLKGKIRLEQAVVEKNKVAQYKITFFGNLVNLKDLIGEDELKDLTYLEQFDHDYTFANVKDGVTDGIEFTVDGEVEKVIKYPLLSPDRRWYYSSDVDATDTPEIVNIAYNDAGQTNGINYYELKPSIGLGWIIKAIEDQYGITFSGDFFTRKEFTELQLWLSRDKGYMRSSGNFLIPFADTAVTNNGFITIAIENQDQQTSTFADIVTYEVRITPDNQDQEYDIIVTNRGEPFRRLTGLKGTQTVEGLLRNTSPDRIQYYQIGFYIASKDPVIFDAFLSVIVTDPSNGNVYEQTLTNQTLNGVVKILEQVPEIKISDFLEGLFKMFNLTIIPQDDGSLEVSTLDEWYNKGRIIDISEYINNDNVPVEKGTILKQINLKFKEGESFLMDKFVNDFGRGYGDIEFILRDDEGNRLDGDELDIELPFEQMIYERLTDENTGDRTQVQYGYVNDNEQEPYKIAPHIFYANRTALKLAFVNVDDTIALKDADESVTELEYAFIPRHTGALDIANYSTTFSADFEEFTGNIIADNLLTNYYIDYITDLFSVKRRLFNFEGVLPSNLLRSLKLNDRCIIGGRRYLINNFRVNLVTKKVRFELINDIYRGETQESLTNKLLLSSTFQEFNDNANSGQFTYQTNEDLNYVTAIETEDIGYGLDWVTPTLNGNTVSYTVDENNTGADRYIVIKLTALNSIAYFKIQQNA